MNYLNSGLAAAAIALGSAQSLTAAELFLVPPPTLTINGQSISTGQITVSNFVGYQGDTAFASTNPPRVRDVTIGSTTPKKIINDPSLPTVDTFDAFTLDFIFDATHPDLVPITVSYVTNTSDFVIDLPLSSNTNTFAQVTTGDTRTTNVYFDEAPSAITTTPGASLPAVDLGNGLFAEFPATAGSINPPLFQSHGTVSNVPVPAGVLLSAGGLAMLGALRSRRQRRA